MPLPLLRRIIGSVLRRIRLRQGRTLQDVARAADVSLPYLSEIERGRKEASSEILAAICRALGIGLGDLLDEARHELARTDPRRMAPRAMASARGSAGAPRCAARLCGGTTGRLRAGVALEAILRAGESFEGTAAVTAR